MGWSRERWQKFIKKHWLETFGLIIAFSALIYGCKPFELFGFMSLDFAENISAEIFGIGISLSLVKILIDYYDSKRWRDGQGSTTFSEIGILAAHITDQVQSAELRYLKDLNLTSAKLGIDVLQKFIVLIETTDPMFGDGMSLDDPNIRFTDIGLAKTAEDLAKHIYRNSIWELDEIQKILIPRILYSPADQDIKELLINFDNVIYEFKEINNEKNGGVIPFIQLSPVGQMQVLIKMYELALSIKNKFK